MSGRHTAQAVNDSLAMSPRLFAGIVGAVMMIAAFIALGIVPVNATDRYISATEPFPCGTVLNPDSALGGDLAANCADATGDRGGWGWPLGAVGLVVILGAVLIRPSRTPKSERVT